MFLASDPLTQAPPLEGEGVRHTMHKPAHCVVRPACPSRSMSSGPGHAELLRDVEGCALCNHAMLRFSVQIALPPPPPMRRLHKTDRTRPSMFCMSCIFFGAKQRPQAPVCRNKGRGGVSPHPPLPRPPVVAKMGQTLAKGRKMGLTLLGSAVSTNPFTKLEQFVLRAGFCQPTLCIPALLSKRAPVPEAQKRPKREVGEGLGTMTTAR